MSTRCRADIRSEISLKNKEISRLRRDIVELTREDYLLSDEEQWYTEEKEEHVITVRPKRKNNLLVGRIHWLDEFKDEATGGSTFIRRSKAVRVNGEWL